MRRRSPGVVVMLFAATAAIAVASCATRPFDRFLAAGDFTAAVGAFAADSALQTSPSAMYRTAVLLASPDLDTYDAAAARRLFTRIIEAHPSSDEATSALRFVVLLDEMDRMAQLASHRESQLVRERDHFQSSAEMLTIEVSEMRERLAELTQRQDLASGYTARLEAMLRERDSQLRDLREELDRLKAIDLRTQQRSGTGG